MSLNPKQIILSVALLSLVSCGETPTSQLTQQFPIIRSGPHDMDFAFIPSGTFRMGSLENEDGRQEWEERHWVKISKDFEIQTTEVTQAQWFAVMGQYPNVEECRNGSDIEAEKQHRKLVYGDDQPVVCINKRDIDKFLRKLNGKNGGHAYRLPTEAEWEYAASGYTETPYSFLSPLRSFAWYEKNSSGVPHQVGKLKPNLFGLYDMHGNVAEYVSDGAAKYEFSSNNSYQNPEVDPKEDFIHYIIVRGGAWDSVDLNCRSSYRYIYPWYGKADSIGIRLARNSYE